MRGLRWLAGSVLALTRLAASPMALAAVAGLPLSALWTTALAQTVRLNGGWELQGADLQ